ncbi:GntR family transcriptional regulator [Aquicoccus sp. G2-2]|uniref:GntR family transcriptional regulator n=1 Tax=Aquicoccus sp. G2-2 TaxID=3092120 RepID=UPI002ADFFC8B|nr:GntR family transcriptional regulator [Aquicoccus sp. G2-2]MEA1114490.1 GntR family transcriptional regulator [Aquicoccus sp. G2-2]
MNNAVRLTWKDVRERIQARILDGTYRPGDKLPRDEDIATELGCARSTVQRAMGALADSGAIERRRKGGTHIRREPVTRATLDIPVARQEVEARGAEYDYKMIRSAMEAVPVSVAAKFGAARVAKMLHVEALHLADRRPYIYEDRWISVETVPDIETVDLSVVSANEWLVANKPYSHGDLRFYAVEADDVMASVLDARVGAALFVTERTTWIAEAPITTVRAVGAPGYQVVTAIA